MIGHFKFGYLTVLAFGLAVLLVGFFRLGGEVFALGGVDDLRSALRDGDGFSHAAQWQRVMVAYHDHDGQKLLQATDDPLATAPFDPVLLSFRALAMAMVAEGEPDLAVISRDLDLAARIGAGRPDIDALRQVVMAVLLQDRPTDTKVAKPAPEVPQPSQMLP